jgi:hypothetical protein
MPFTVRPSRRFPPLAYCSAVWPLITLLLVSVGPVFAEWVKAMTYETRGMTVYIDPDTRRTEGNLLKMWVLLDFKSTQIVRGKMFLSLKDYSEYDCAKVQIRQFAQTGFSGNMESGKVVYTTADEGNWEPIVPRSLAHTVWTYVCSEQ